MSRLLDQLYVGSLDDVQCRRRLSSLDVTHILTVDQKPLDSAYRQGLAYLHIPLLDEDTEDILSKFDDYFNFIDTGRSSPGGGVIVHCHAGLSRGPAVAVAYIMVKLKMTLDDTLSYVRRFKPDARPNDGFLAQLAMLEEMDFCVDRGHHAYKSFRLQSVARMITHHADASSLKSFLLSRSEGLSGNATSVYKCKKCRTLLFKDTAVLQHLKGKGAAAFVGSSKAPPASSVSAPLPKAGRAAAAEELRCHDAHAVFIEPVGWMEPHIAELQGKILCPKCSVKIGSWSWAGDTCTCGRWVTPSFLIHMSKVDRTAVVVPAVVAVTATMMQRKQYSDVQHEKPAALLPN